VKLTTTTPAAVAQECRVTVALLSRIPLASRRDIEDAPGVEPLPVIRPGTAQIGFRRSAIGPVPTVKGAAGARLVQEATRGDHFRLQGVFVLPADLAQVGRKPRSHQSFEPLVGSVTEDFHLEIPAACRSPLVVGGGARSDRAGVDRGEVSLEDWQSAGGGQRHHRRELMVLHDQKLRLAQLTRLKGPPRRGRECPPEAMRGAAARFLAWQTLQVPAANVESGIDEQIHPADAEIPKADPLRVSQQPSGLVIGRLRSFFQRTNPEGDGYLLALGAEVGAWRSGVHPGNLTAPRTPSPSFGEGRVCL
jgi:hypothetical protein